MPSKLSKSPPGQAPIVRAGRRLRPILVAIVVVSILATAITALLRETTGISTPGMTRFDPFSAIAGRPQKSVSGPLNILLVGIDSPDLSGLPMDQWTKWHADAIMIVHIPSSHNKAFIVSLQRDMWGTCPTQSRWAIW